MSVIPQEYAFAREPQSVQLRRLPVRQLSDTQSYTQNSKITIQLPNDFADLRNSTLSFYAKLTASGGTYAALQFPVQSMFSMIKVYLGSTLIEQVDSYGLLAGIFKEVSSNQAVTAVPLEGNYDLTKRKAESVAGRLYVVHLRLESLQRIWPLHKTKIPLRIEAQIDTINNFTYYDGAAPTLTVNSVYLNYSVIQPDPAVESVIDSAIAAGNMNIYFRSWDVYSTQIGASSNATLLLPFKRSVVQTILSVARPQADVGDPTVDGKYVDDFAPYSTLTTSYVKILNLLYPQDKYDTNFGVTGNQLMAPVLNSIMQDTTHPYDRQEDTFSLADYVNRVVAAYDLRLDSGPNVGGLRGNGIDTSGSANSQSLGLTWSALTAALEIQAFARYEVTVKILPNGNIQLFN